MQKTGQYNHSLEYGDVLRSSFERRKKSSFKSINDFGLQIYSMCKSDKKIHTPNVFFINLTRVTSIGNYRVSTSLSHTPTHFACSSSSIGSLSFVRAVTEWANATWPISIALRELNENDSTESNGYYSSILSSFILEIVYEWRRVLCTVHPSGCGAKKTNVYATKWHLHNLNKTKHKKLSSTETSRWRWSHAYPPFIIPITSLTC